MKTESVFYICHAVIVVVFMGVVTFVVYRTDNYTYLWLLLAILVYQPWYKLKEVKNPEEDSEKE